MKTFRSKPNFIAKPSARVQAMAKKYGTLEIAKKDPYGANLLKDGYGTFDGTDTETWQVSGTNTITNVDSTLKITYVDNADGAYVYLNPGGLGGYSGDLADVLEQGKTYQSDINVKVTAGTARIRISDGELNPFEDISNKDFITISLTFIVSTSNPYLRIQNFGLGEDPYVDWYTIREVL